MDKPSFRTYNWPTSAAIVYAISTLIPMLSESFGVKYGKVTGITLGALQALVYIYYMVCFQRILRHKLGYARPNIFITISYFLVGATHLMAITHLAFLEPIMKRDPNFIRAFVYCAAGLTFLLMLTNLLTGITLLFYQGFGKIILIFYGWLNCLVAIIMTLFLLLFLFYGFGTAAKITQVAGVIVSAVSNCLLGIFFFYFSKYGKDVVPERKILLDPEIIDQV